MTFFGSYGTTADEVNENPFAVAKRAVYPVVISDADVKSFKDGGPEYFIITYEIEDGGGVEAGKNASRMFRIKPLGPSDGDNWETQNARTVSNFKKALLELGLNPQQINQFDPTNLRHREALVGIRGEGVIGPQKDRADYNQVFGFTRKSAGTGGPVGEPETSAPVSDENVDDLLSGWQ